MSEQRGPRSVMEWVDGEDRVTLDITPTVGDDGVGHVYVTAESRPCDWDENDEVSSRVAVDLDVDNAADVRNALAAAIEWLGRHET